MKTYKIYTLSSAGGNVFYVGCTQTKLNKRLSGHLNDARKGKNNKAKNDMIVELGFNVIITEVDSIDIPKGYSSVMASIRERVWIKEYRNAGYVLCNKLGNTKLAA